MDLTGVLALDRQRTGISPTLGQPQTRLHRARINRRRRIVQHDEVPVQHKLVIRRADRRSKSARSDFAGEIQVGLEFVLSLRKLHVKREGLVFVPFPHQLLTRRGERQPDYLADWTGWRMLARNPLRITDSPRPRHGWKYEVSMQQPDGSLRPIYVDQGRS